MSDSISFDDALPCRLIMKLACFGDTIAPPTCFPFSPHDSIRCAAKLPRGFLKTEPQLYSLVGWVLARCANNSLISRSDFSFSPLFKRQVAATNHSSCKPET